MPAATAHAAIRHDASGLRACRAHVAHLLWRSDGSCGTRFVLFVCEGNDTDYYLVACFWCSFADSECAFCAGRQLRLRMLRSGMMHRGCGRPVRTLRTFLYDRAAPMAPVLYFLCAKQMTDCCFVFFRHVIPVYPSQYTNDTDYDVACFCCSFADSECAFCAG